MTEEEELVRRKEYASEWMKKYRREHKEQLAVYSKNYRETHREEFIWRGAKSASKRRGIEFSIEISDIVIPKYCIYLGCRITNTINDSRQGTNSSIDRIDPSKGYVKGNIQIISDLANRMKSNATEEQLIAFAEGVLRIHDRVPNTKVSSCT